MSTMVQTPETAKAASRWEDFIDVFFSPSELFRRRANDGWGTPFLVLCVVGLIVYYVFLPVTRALTEAAMANQPGLTPQQQAAAQNMAGTFAILGGIIVPLFLLIFIMVSALITFIACKFASVEMGFRRALMIMAFAGFLTYVNQIIGYVLMSFKLRSGAELDPIKDMSFGVLRFMNTEAMNAGLVGLLSRIDVFALWQFGLVAIALMAASRAPRRAALAVATVVWLAGSLPVMLQALTSR